MLSEDQRERVRKQGKTDLRMCMSMLNRQNRAAFSLRLRYLRYLVALRLRGTLLANLSPSCLITADVGFHTSPEAQSKRGKNERSQL